jgi:hypothetical protein
MNYNKIIGYCDKYDIKRYTDFGVPFTCNKLKHVMNDHINKKHKRSQKHTIYNSTLTYLEDEIDELVLSKAMHHFIGN